MAVHDERQVVPAAALRPWVAELRVMTSSPVSPRIMTRLPNGASSLVLCATHGGGIKVLAVGPSTRAFYKQVGSVPMYARIAFRPGGARAAFGAALHELADRVVPIEELWGRAGAGVVADLERSGGGVDAAARVLERALLERVGGRDGDASCGLLQRAVAALDAAGAEAAQVHALARRLRVSERYLRKLFCDYIGISPKRYARIARIRRVVASAGSRDWARLAGDHGFYDQAHLSTEFRDLLGVSPRAFLAGELPTERPLCGS
jgi:AraC-like DNA-binding protein